VEVVLSSSYSGFGTSSLSKDAKELGRCVEYFKSLGPNAMERKVVIMGHSTGSQDCMEYAVGKESVRRPRVDGLVLQGSVSDRQALREHLGEEKYGRIVGLVKEYVASGRSDDIIPAFREGIRVYGRAPVTAYRWNSILSAEGPGVGDDDYFSSDLSDERLKDTFGKLSVPLMVLFSGDDEHCPKFVHKETLIEKWGRVVKESGGIVDDENGGIVQGATHNLEGNREEVVRDLCRRVCGFLRRVEREDFTSDTVHL
jgi:pimeloyl-ACP methyl ester carboxylesterase